jgi:hypothetical protein
MTKAQKITIFLLLSTFYFLISNSVLAAILYLEPSSREYQPGDVFSVEVKIDTEEECINAIEANLSFSQNILKATDFSQGQSIITLWVKPPEINQEAGLISLSGGIPGGYCGRIPGDPEATNSLGKIIFRIPGMIVGGLPEDLAKVEILDTSQVFLNDGLGTPAKLTTRGAAFKIVPVRAEPLEEDWYQEIKKDTTLPELFEIEIHKDPLIFEGKYFIIFSTTDKQTGIDYYEVKEGKGDWKKAGSPYLLEDQSLNSIIKIKAVDKAGNERIAEYTPPKKPFPYWIIILVLIGAGIIWWIIRKKKIESRK